MSFGPSELGLIGGLEKRAIRIVEYNPEWPQQFDRHAERIRKALGGTALQISHIGSTAVPGLAAKPIIDILVVVSSSADESSYLPQMEAAGFELRVREPDWHEHRMFRTPARDVHVHVYSDGCEEIERNVIFRDRLRTHDRDRQRYRDLKQQLASRDWPDMNAYAAAKTELVEDIIAAARSSMDSLRQHAARR